MLQRYVGATVRSRELSSLFGSLADELAARASVRDAPDLRLHDSEFLQFRRALEAAATSAAIVIFIDGLDQLDLDPRSPLWDMLGAVWPRSVRFVLSAATGPAAERLRCDYRVCTCLPCLRWSLDQLAALDARLAEVGRCLQLQQRDELVDDVGGRNAVSPPPVVRSGSPIAVV